MGFKKIISPLLGHFPFIVTKKNIYIYVAKEVSLQKTLLFLKNKKQHIKGEILRNRLAFIKRLKIFFKKICINLKKKKNICVNKNFNLKKVWLFFSFIIL